MFAKLIPSRQPSFWGSLSRRSFFTPAAWLRLLPFDSREFCSSTALKGKGSFLAPFQKQFTFRQLPLKLNGKMFSTVISELSEPGSDVKNVDSILNFWFEGLPSDQVIDEGMVKELEERNSFWFRSDQDTDNKVRTSFFTLIEKARKGHLADWESEPRSALAVVILLDQFTRNCFRNTAEAFSRDNLALSVAERAIANGFDKNLPIHMRAFFYLPFMHSERLDIQELSLKYFRELEEDSPQYLKGTYKFYYEFSVAHREVIKKYGRFPHRNPILGRESTPEEEEYIASGKGF